MAKRSIENRERISGPWLSEVRLRSAASQAASASRYTGNIGAAAGVLLGLVFLPLAIAHADEWTVIPDPDSVETVTGIYGYGFGGALTTPPAVSGSIQGYGLFDYHNFTTGASGVFNGLESTSRDGLEDYNHEVYVASDIAGTGAPTMGSVFDTANVGNGALVNVYSDIYSPTGDTITDTVTTPFGSYSIPSSFDAANISVADAGGVTIGSGAVVGPDGLQTVSAITGIPPLFIALQGSQPFYTNASDGAAFQADNTITQDILGTYTEAVLVASDAPGATVGTGADDIPAVGSIFNTIDFGGIQNVYSELVSTGGAANIITDTLKTPLGDFVIPITFDAAKAETTDAIHLPDGAELTPVGALDFIGINGLPPENVSVQGVQAFTYTDVGSSGAVNADVTNTLDLFGNVDETILVTSSTDPAITVGSVFETVNSADSGFGSVYSDIVAAGGTSLISDTLETPWGDFPVPVYLDAAAGLAADLFKGA